MHWLSARLMHWQLILLVQVSHRIEVPYAHQVRPDWDSNLRHPNHDAKWHFEIMRKMLPSGCLQLKPEG